MAKQALKEERDKKKQEKAKKVAEQRELRMNLFYKFREIFMSSLKEIKLNKNRSHTQDEINSAKRCLDFINQIREVPSRVCCCCEGLFFKNYTRSVDMNVLFMKYCRKLEEFKNSGKTDKYDRVEFTNTREFQEYITGYDSEFLCLTCFRNLENGRIPLINPHCGIKVPEVPKEIEELTDFMERLVSPVLPFMQIRELQPYAVNPQLGIKGSVINIIPGTEKMLHVLPRKFNETNIIQLKLKRHMSHKTDYMFETFSVQKLMKALALLINTPLYQDYKIQINEKNFEEYDPYFTGTQVNFVIDDSDANQEKHANDDKNESATNETDMNVEEMDVDEDMIIYENINPHFMSKASQNLPIEANPIETDVEMLLENLNTRISSSNDAYQFKIFENGFKATCFGVSNFQFTLLCAFNSVFHGLNTSYRSNKEFHRFIEEKKDLITYFKLISELSYNSDKNARNQLYINFLFEKSFAGLEIDDKDIRKHCMNMEYDSAIILENFLSLDGITTLLPSYKKYARCNKPDCNGISSTFMENSLIYVKLNETENLNEYIGDKVRIATNTISESDIFFSCDKCKRIINVAKKNDNENDCEINNIRCITEYEDLLIINVQSYKQISFDENIMQLDPFYDIPLTFYANNDEYQLLFFVHKSPGHYTSYYYKTEDEIILVDDLQNRHEFLHRSNKNKNVNPSLLIYFKKPKEHDVPMDVSFDGFRSKDVNLNDCLSDDVSPLKELFSALNISGGNNPDESISSVDTEMMEDIENEEKLYDGKEEMPPDNQLEDILMLKDINIDDMLQGNLETDVKPDKSFFMNDKEKDKVKEYAPGQGEKPVPSQNIPNYDEICFPKTYGGHKMTYDRKKISYTRVIRAEIKHYRRKRSRPVLILFKVKEKYKRDLRNRISIAIRKTTKGKNMTAKDVRDGKAIDDRIKNNIAYLILSTIRSSPMYFRRGRINALAMLNQLNYPHIFFTCSMAESFSPELLQQMHKNVYGKEITLLEALQMTPAEKSKLVRDDPVSCAEFFNHRLNSLGTYAGDKTGNGLLGKNYVTNFIHRKEAQGRGTMHSHQIWWCKDAPRLNVFEPDEKLREANEKEVIDFIDETISTEYIEDHPNIHFHVHNCTHSCYKGKKGKVKKCRFNFPHFVSNKTKIIYPIPLRERTEKMMKDLIKIREKMKHYKKTRELQSFEDMLKELDLNEDDYFNAVRCAYKRIDVLYKRESNAVSINTYIKKLLDTWEGNHDAQYIPDPYGFVYYLSKYCLKADEGMLDMMRRAAEECKEGNKTVIESMAKIASIFLGTSFIGAQQAVEEILGFAILKFSNAVFFINTNRPEKRVGLRKSKAELEEMDDDDEDITIPGFIEQYENRPKDLDEVCLADFAALYKKEGEKEHADSEDDTDNENDDDDDESNNQRKKKRKSYPKKYVLRTRERIIRYVGFKKEMNEAEYFREMVMLFLPWRNEEDDILNADTKEIFKINRNEILEKYARYNSIGPEKLEKLLEEVDENLKDLNEEEIRRFYDLQEVDDHLIPKVDVFEELGINRNVDGKTTAKKDNSYVLTKPSKINQQELYEKIMKLNEKQQLIVQHIYHYAKTRDEEMNLPTPKILLLGPAGTGKSLTIETINQLLTHFYDFTLGQNEDSAKVLLAAYTGVAAFLIGGSTCHNAFCLKVGFKGRSINDDGPKNNIRSIHRDVQAIIIDECSLISRNHRKQIDQNCRIIYGNNKDSFGGKIVMFVGDLLQLQPVCGLPIFKTIEDFGKDRTILPKDLFEELQADVVWDEFRLFELTEIVRQKNVKFQIALNNLARGKLTEDDIKLLNERVVKDESLIPKDAIRLFYTNLEVMRYNLRKIKEVKGTLHKVAAIDEIKTKCTNEKIKRAILNEYVDKQISDAEYKSISSTNLRSSVPIKIGIKYMIIVNIDVSDGLVNGAFGKCENITFGKDGNVLILWLAFDNKKIGANMRMPYIEFMKANNIPLHLVPIIRLTHDMTANQNEMKKTKYKIVHEAFRTQFPVTPCEALTIHKTQGLTIPKVAVNCENIKTADLLYVAISRCDYEGLYIIGEFKAPAQSKSTKNVIREIERLRIEAPLELSFYNFEQNCGKKIIYHNVSSFNLHKNLIISIDWYWKADVIIFSEANVDHVDEKSDIRKGFTVLYPSSKYQQVKKRSRGLVILCKEQNDVRNLSEPIIVNDVNAEWQLDLRTFEIEDHYVITGYRSPKTPYNVFEETIIDLINKKPANLFLTMIGDFNYNLRIESKFRMYLVENKIINHLKDEITRDQRTQVDIVVSTSTKGRAGNFASVFSDHFAIFYQTEYDFSIADKNIQERQKHKEEREAITKQNREANAKKKETKRKRKKNQSTKVKKENVSNSKNVIFENSIAAVHENCKINFCLLCPYNAVYHGFATFFKNNDIFMLMVNDNKHIPFYNFLIEILYKIENSEERNQLWIDFILAQCSNTVEVTSQDISDKEKDMRNDIVEVLNAFFINHISVHLESIPCKNAINKNDECTGSSLHFSSNIITLFDMNRGLKSHLQDRVLNCAKNRVTTCQKCRLTINSSNYNPIFGNILIINLTFSNDDMTLKVSKFQEPRVEIPFTDIPSELYLNGERFELKLIFDHPPDHFTSYYIFNEKKLLLLDDLKGEKTLCDDDIEKLRLNIKALVFFKIGKNLSRLDSKIKSETQLVEKVHNTNTKNIKRNNTEDEQKQVLIQNVEKKFKYVIFSNTFDVKLNDTNIEKLSLMCTFNSFFHGFSTSCKDERFHEYLIENSSFNSFFKTLLSIMETQSQSNRNLLWYQYIRNNIPPENLSLKERCWPFRVISEVLNGNILTKTYKMAWNQENLILNILKDFASFSWEFKCSQCDYHKLKRMRCFYIYFQNTQELKDSFENIFIEQIREKNSTCTNCKIKLSYTTIILHEVLIFKCRFGAHSQVEVGLDDIPSVIHLENGLIYDLKFIINFIYDEIMGHFNCYVRISPDCIGPYFIYVDDIGPKEKIIKLSDCHQEKINPYILVYFRNAFSQ